MATLSVSPGSFDLDMDDIDWTGFTSTSDTVATGFRFNFSDGSYWAFVGTGLVYGGPNGLPTGGTLTGFTAFEAGDVAAVAVSDILMAAATFSDFVQMGDEPGFISALLATADIITGGSLDDNIRGEGGNDSLVGGDGHDRIEGGGGNDWSYGGEGRDVLEGGDHNDTLYGDIHDDILFGDDVGTSLGEPGNDIVYGGAGRDILFGGVAIDTAFGGEGNDFGEGGGGDDYFDGGSGNDLAFGSEGVDFLFGGNGADALLGGGASDVVYGDGGDDWLMGDGLYKSIGDIDFVFGGFGADLIFGGDQHDELFGDEGDDYIDGGSQGDEIWGGSENDRMIGDDGNDSIDGQAGDDFAWGGSDSDVIDGNEGDDWLEGGGGDDQLRGSSGVDTLIGGDGSDELRAGSDNDMAFGDAGDDLLGGSDGDDTLLGGLGNDFIALEDGSDSAFGGEGDDILIGDLGNDTHFGGSGNDLLNGDGDSDLLYGGTENDRLDGAADNDIIYGDQGADILFGGSGDDRLYGGAGDDVIYGGTGNDVIVGGGGIDTVVYSDFVTTLASSGNTLTIDAGVHGIDILIDIDVVRNFPPPSTIDVSNLLVTDGFIVTGALASDRAGYEVAGSGDINGDGFADLILSAFGADQGGEYSGSVYVVFGSVSGFGSLDGNGRSVIDLESLGTAQGFVVQGDTIEDFLSRVSSAGDVNGDGFADLIIGAWYGDDDGDQAGEAYVIFGAASGFGTVDGSGRSVIDLSALGTLDGFVIQGDTAGDYAGIAVASAGDVNGDGFDDLLVGASRGDDGGDIAGEAYLIFGSSGSFGFVDGTDRQILDLSNIGPTEGLVIQGDTARDRLGRGVASAGDINGDGLDDILIGAYTGDDGGPSAGEAYVIFGSQGTLGSVDGTGRRVLDVSSLSPTIGFILQGIADSRTGQSVAGAGDINGDGLDDMIISSSGIVSEDQGAVYVIFGSSSSYGSIDGTGRRVLDLASLTSAQGFILLGISDDERAGRAISSAGDINGDGFQDLLIGAYFSDEQGNNSGKAYVIFGSQGGFGTFDLVSPPVINLANLNSLQGFVIAADTADDHLGMSVTAAGDVNGDGFDDIFVGAEQGDDAGDNAGEAYVLFGSPSGLSTSLTLAGTAGSDTLIGGSAPDVLIGNGGLDVLRGGSGDDLMRISEAGFADIDGGRGDDTLALVGNGIHLNLAATRPAEIRSIERIDIAGSGSNTLGLDYLSALDLTERRGENIAAIRVDGSSDDIVNLDQGWIDIGDTTANGVTYDRWQFDPDAGGPLPPSTHFELWIDQDIDVLFPP